MVISKESINYSLRNIKHRKRRSLLTIFSIFLGITTIFIFVSFGWGLYDYIGELSSSGSTDKIIVQAKGTAAPGLDNSFQLTDDDLEAVEDANGVIEVTGVYFKIAEAEKRSERLYTFLLAFNPDKPLIMDVFNVDVEEGRMLMKGDGGKVLLGYNYMIDDKIFSKGLNVNDKIDIEGKSMRVVGFMEEIGNPQDDSQIYITNDYIDELYPENVTTGRTNSYGWIVARVETENIEQVIKNVEKKLRDERNQEEGKEDFFVQSFVDLIESYSSALNIVIGFVVLIALISVVVSAVNTANTMITSVIERTKEIGVLKSIGARNSEIFKIFLFESGFLGFVAGVVGVILGFILTFLGAEILAQLGYSFLKPHYSVWIFVGGILFATLTGAISGVIPAVSAMKTNPVDALRYE